MRHKIRQCIFRSKWRRPRKGKEKPPVRKQDQISREPMPPAVPRSPVTLKLKKQYQLAAEIAPDDARAFAGLGNVYVDQGRFARQSTRIRKRSK